MDTTLQQNEHITENTLKTTIETTIKTRKWHFSFNNLNFSLYFDSNNSNNSHNSNNSSEYNVVFESDDESRESSESSGQSRIYMTLKRTKNKFESQEVVMDEDIEVLGGPVYSYKVLLKFNKHGDISPVSTLYIRRCQSNTKMIALSLDSLVDR